MIEGTCHRETATVYEMEISLKVGIVVHLPESRSRMLLTSVAKVPPPVKRDGLLHIEEDTL